MNIGPYLEFDAGEADVHHDIGNTGAVEMSVVSDSDAESIPRPMTVLKYVAEGAEIYSYGGRTYRVPANSFLVLPEGNRGAATIDRTLGPAVGMCIFLPRRGQFCGATDSAPIEAPVVFPARSSRLGGVIASTHRRIFSAPASERPALSRDLLDYLDTGMEAFLGEATALIDQFDSVKRATRLEHLRRLNIARHYLHEITDRIVDLAELARWSGMSRFQLARLFAQAFGEPPATYHRSIRLDAARVRMRESGETCAEIAHSHGFADSAHFSRAYKTRFGESPSAARFQ